MDIESQRLKDRLKVVRNKINETGYAVKQSKRRGHNKGHNERVLEAHSIQGKKPVLGNPVELMKNANLAAGNDLSTKEDDDLAGGNFFNTLGKIARVGSDVIGVVPTPYTQLASTALGTTASLTGNGKKSKKNIIYNNVESKLKGKGKAKPKRKQSQKQINRGLLVKKLMKEEGLKLADASKAIKERGLSY